VWTGLFDPDAGLTGPDGAGLEQPPRAADGAPLTEPPRAADGAPVAEGPRAADGAPFDAARLLVRVAGEPLGFVEMPLTDGRLDRDALDERIAREPAAAAAAARGAGDAARGAGASAANVGERQALGWLAAGRTTPVSVIVCTRDRPAQLARCLDALRRLEHDELEMVIVDNAPADDATERLVAALAAGDPRLRYVREERPGLSHARNRGLREARAGIVAFTDDDVLVDPLWAAALVRGFARDPRVACVTGLVAPASLGRPEERYFDARVSWSSSCEQRLYTAARGAGDSLLHPFAAGAFGTGANMAFRTTALRVLGDFDECLGAGSPAGGGEDLDVFLRVLLGGGLIAYEPAALVWHEHRAAPGALDRQMFAYGRGLTAYLFKHATSRRSAPAMARRLAPGLVRLAGLTRASRRATRGTATARRAPLWEVAGSLTGPYAYWRGRQVAARSTRMS